MTGENAMNALEAIQNRRSYRGKYKPDPVPHSDLEIILQADHCLPGPVLCSAGLCRCH